MADAARAKWSGPAKRARTADDDFVVDDDDDGTGAARGKDAKGKKKRAPQPFVDAVIAQLSAKRKLTVGKFNGAVTIGIREFYEKDGQVLPGAKGISLTKEQWEILIAHAPQVDAALASLPK